MNFLPHRRRAFSLVEVVLAMGIISFALLSMFGLISISLKSDRESASDTVLSTMSRVVVNDLRSLPFTTFPTSKYYYFSIEGSPCVLADGSLNTSSLALDPPPTSAFYECAVTVKDVAIITGTRPGKSVFHSIIANYGN